MIAISWLLAWSLAGAQTSGCTTPTPEGRQVVTNFVSGPAHESARARLQIARSSEADIRALTGKKDAPTCARLLAVTLATLDGHELHGLSPSFYAAGDYYYVTLSRKQRTRAPLHVRTGFVPLYVIDRQFVLVRALAQ